MKRQVIPWWRGVAMTRLVSVVVTLSMVLGLVPSQGMAEARNEILDLVGQEQPEERPREGAEETDAVAAEGDDAAGEVATSGAAAFDSDEAAREEAVAAADDSHGAGASVTAPEATRDAEPTYSSNLRDFVVDASIEGTDAEGADAEGTDAEGTDAETGGSGGGVVVREGTDYKVRLTFAENAEGKSEGRQFAGDGELTYELPAGFSPAADQPTATDPLAVRYLDGGGEWQAIWLEAGSWWVDGNVLHLVWKTKDDPDGETLARMAAIENLRVELEVMGTFAAGVTEVDFGARAPIALSVVAAGQGERPATAAASFDAAGFSAHALGNAAALTHEGYTYVMPRQGSAPLSSVLLALGIGHGVTEVADVATESPGLLAVSREAVGSDWRIAAPQALAAPARLCVTMNTGDRYVVDVVSPSLASAPAAARALGMRLGTQATTSDDLADYLTYAGVAAATDSDGAYVVMPGEKYVINLSFAESYNTQFPTSGGEMTLALPEGLSADNTDWKSFDITLVDPYGQAHKVEGNTYRIENGQLKVKLKEDADLNASANVRFGVSFEGSFDGTRREIEFADGITVDVEVDNTSKVTSSKSARFDLAAKKVYYTVAITSTGKSENVRITDAITDTASPSVLSLRGDSIQATSNKAGSVTLAPTPGVSGNTLDYTIPSMANGEVVTLTYEADIDTSKIPGLDSGSPQVVVGNNRVSVRNEKMPEPVESNVQTRIDYSPRIQKDGMTLNEDGKSFHCSYTFNGDAAVGVPNRSMTDTLGQYLTLDGVDGVTVKVKNANGDVVSEGSLGFGTSSSLGSVTKASDNKSFTYTTPNDLGAYQYVVEYDAKVDGTASSLSADTTVTNTVKVENDGESTGTGVITPAEHDKVKVTKTVDDIDYANKEISWTTSIHVPESGLTDAYATLTDSLEGKWYDDGTGNEQMFDSFENGSFEFSGLKDSEHAEVEVGGDGHTATVRFYKSTGVVEPGLAGPERYVTVRYKTKINEKWLKAAATQSYYVDHGNTAQINGVPGYATAHVAGAGVTKSSEVAGWRTVGGVQLPVYKYELELKNVTDDYNEIVDTFDRDLLVPLYTVDGSGSNTAVDGFNPNYFAWHATNVYYGARSAQPVSYVDTAEGMRIVTSYDSMVHDPTSTTGFYPVTKIIYYLTVKDEAAYKKIQNRAIANGGTYTIGNTATWEDTTDPGDITYRYPGIVKEMLTPESELTQTDEDVNVKFRVTINPGAAQVNQGRAYDVEDTVRNLSIDIKSIEVDPNPTDGNGNGTITYDMSGDTLTLHYVPDSTKVVLTYTARVKFGSIGNTGDTVRVDFSNEARMLTYEDEVDKTAYRKNAGEGRANLYAVNLMKYETGNMGKKLNGATFQLFNSKPDASDTKTGYVIDRDSPVLDKSGNAVTFVSGESDVDQDGTNDEGMVGVFGDMEADGWAIEPDTYYFLEEIEAPPDHMLADFDYQFMVSSDGTTDYDRYIYHSSDTMSAKNTLGTDVNVVKDWGGGYAPADDAEVVVRLQQRFLVKSGDGWTSPADGTEAAKWSDTIYREDGQGAFNEAGDTEGTLKPYTLTLDKDGGWKGSFKGLPVFVSKDGVDTKVEYQVKEDKYRVSGQDYVDADTTVETNAANGDNGEFRWTYQPQGNTRAITNTPVSGSLKLKKQVTVNGAATSGKLADGTYAFDVRGADDANKTVSKAVAVTVENGAVKSATVDGEAATIDGDGFVTVGGLKLGRYTVSEQTSDNGTALTAVEGAASASVDGQKVATVEVEGSTAAQVEATKTTFTNNVDVGGLKVKKVVTVNGGSADAEGVEARTRAKLAGTYAFEVFTDEACTTRAVTQDGLEASATVTIGDDGRAATSGEIENLPVGTYYVRETVPEGSAAEPTANPVEVAVEKGKAADAAAVVTLTNNLGVGSLKIRKTVTVNGVEAKGTSAFGTQDGADGTFAFQISRGTKGAKADPMIRVEVTFEHGIATAARYEFFAERTKDESGKVVSHWSSARLVDGEVYIDELEPGGYVVHEMESNLPNNADDSMRLVGENGQECEVTANNVASIPTAAFTNDRTVAGELTLSKEVISHSRVLAGQVVFTFTVTMYKDAERTLVDTSVNGNYGGMTFADGVATVKLVGGQSAKAENLPTGTYYRVTEASAVGWTLSGKTGDEGAITTTPSEAKFENSLDEGGLTVRKEVESSFANDRRKQFTFTVELQNMPLTGTYGEGVSAMTFDSGKATFKLADGESRTATGLPAGARYVVTETSEEGFSTTWSGDTGTSGAPGTIVKDATKTTTATNRRLTGELSLSKRVVSSNPADQSSVFTFTVTLSDRTINGIFGDGADGTLPMKFENGIAKVQISGERTALAKGLPVGVAYIVTEEKADHFTLAGKTGDSGKISTARSGAAFTNARDEGGLLVSKQVVSPSSVDKTKYFTYKVTIYTDATRSKVDTGVHGAFANSDITFDHGVGYVLLRHGEQAAVYGLRAGHGYQVEELSTTAQTVGLAGKTVAEVPASLWGSLGDFATTVKNGSTSGLPATGTIQRGETSTATISAHYTNHRITGGLTVSKSVVSDAAADQNREFGFTVTLYSSYSSAVSNTVDASVSGTFGDMTFDGGVAHIKLKGGQSAAATNLPVGMRYTVSEDDANTGGFTLSGTTGTSGNPRTGTVRAAGVTEAFENTRERGSFTVAKKIVSDATADQSQEFDFKVQLSDTSINKTYSGVTFKNGVATIKVKGGESKTLEGLPTGIRYVVTETTAAGFTMTGTTVGEDGGQATDGNGGVVSTTPSTVTFENARVPGDLSVSKKLVSDASADAEREFTFRVRLDGLTDDAKAKRYAVVYENPTKLASFVTFTNGEATVTLVGGQKATIKGLPTGVGYTVTEVDAPGFSVTKEADTGTITTTPTDAIFTNTALPGRLTVSKELVSERTADRDQSFEFEVTLYKTYDAATGTGDVDPISKTYGGVTFVDGKATISLKGGETKAIDGLPRGIRYTVTEKGVPDFALTGVADTADTGYVGTKTTASGTISEAESKARFRNERDRGGFSFAKKVTGLVTDQGQDFDFTITLSGAPVSGTGYGRYYANGADATGTPISFSRGVANVKLKAGGHAVVENLPVGVTYQVMETRASGFATTTDGVDDEGTALWRQKTDDAGNVVGVYQEGTVAPRDDAMAYGFPGPTFTNAHVEGGLQVQKVLESDYAPDDKDYEFRVELSDKSITSVANASDGAYAGGYATVANGDKVIPFVRGVATFTLRKGEVASIRGLPAGTRYTVTETTITEGVTRTYADTVTVTADGVTTEKAVDTRGLGTIVQDETAKTVVTNSRQFGKLDLTKEVVSHTPDDKTRKYEFAVDFYTDKDMTAPATDVSGTYKVGTADAVSFSGGKATGVQLADDETATFEHLPLGVYYKVVETDANGMTTTTKLGQTTEDSGKVARTTTSRFTNTRVEGGLFVYKNVSSHIAQDLERSFDFRVTLYTDEACTKEATSVNGTYGEGESAMTFLGGVSTFKLKDGEFRYAVSLPTGLYFKAMEANDADFTTAATGTVEEGASNVSQVSDGKYTITKIDGTTETIKASTGAKGQIAAKSNVNATITNTRRGGNLKVTKADSSTVGADEEFAFIVELEDKTVKGTFGEGEHALTFNDGVATFTLRKGEYRSTEEAGVEGGLPIGMRYRVTERHANNVLTTWESKTWANGRGVNADGSTTYKNAVEQTWTPEESPHDDCALWEPDTETKTITWTDASGTHTSSLSHDIGRTGTEGSGDVTSWTKEDVSTEWGWRERNAAGELVGEVQRNAITEGHTDEVTFTNDQEVGDITIFKNVLSPIAADMTKTFHFSVTLLDEVADGAYGDMYFKDGVAYASEAAANVGAEGFELSAGQTVTAEGLPKGTRYVIGESADANFDSEDANTHGVVGYGNGGESEMIADRVREKQAASSGKPDYRAPGGFNNTRKAGELQVSKTVASDVASDREQRFTFEVALDDASFSSTFYPLVWNEGESEWQVDGESPVTFRPNGGKSVATITLADGESARFYKSVVGEPADGEIAYVPAKYVRHGTIIDDDGAEREVWGWDLDELACLPKGVGYTVRETDSKGLFASWSGTTEDHASGIISSTTVATADCTNTRTPGDLTVSKEVISDSAADQSRAFDFTVQLYSDAQHKNKLTLSGRYGDMVFDDEGKASVTLTGGDSATATGLPSGVYYHVTEASAPNFWLKGITKDGGERYKSNGSGQVGTESVTETFTNERLPGMLRLSKSLFSDATVDQGEDFNFTVRLADTSINKTYPVEADHADDKPLEFKNGVATVTLKKDEYASAEGLPLGLAYSVSEDEAPGFDQDQEVFVNGVVDAGNTNAMQVVDNDGRKVLTQENTRKTGDLTVSKVLVSDRDADRDQEFDFTVTLYSTYAGPGSEENVVDTGISKTYGDMAFERGVAHVTLKGGESATAAGLPTGLTYIVEEESVDGFELRSVVGNAGVITTAGQSATFTNERIITGDLMLGKVAYDPEPYEEGAEPEFAFAVMLNDDSISGTYPTLAEGDKPLTFTGGVAAVSLKSGEVASAAGLPAGVHYNIVETDAPGYETRQTYQLTRTTIGEDGISSVVADDPEQVITEGELCSATFYNTRDSAELKVRKVWDTADAAHAVLPDAINVYLQKDGEDVSELFAPAASSDSVQAIERLPQPWVILSAENGWEQTVVVPKYDREGREIDLDRYTWREEEGAAYELAGSASDALVTTLTNRLRVGSLKVVKHVEGTTLTESEKAAVKFTVADARGNKVDERSLADFTVAEDEVDPSWTLEGLPVGTYTVTETGATRERWTVTTTFDVTDGEANREGGAAVAQDKAAVAQSRAAVAQGKTTVVRVTNSYGEDKGALRVTKLVTGDIGLAGLTERERHAIAFAVTDAQGNVVATNTLDRFEVAPGAAGPSWTLEGLPVGTYTVTETGAARTGWTVSATYDVEGGRVAVAKDATSELTVTNAYVGPRTSAKLSARKTLSGRALAEGEFSFELRDAAGRVLQTKTNDASGGVSFDEVEYGPADVGETFSYDIAEVVPPEGERAEGVTYDEHVAKVTVAVSAVANGSLLARVTYDAAAPSAFENTYTPPDTPPGPSDTPPSPPDTPPNTPTVASPSVTRSIARVAQTGDPTGLAAIQTLAATGALSVLAGGLRRHRRRRR